MWELTLKCDLACRHCGSRAGVARDGELSRDEALAIVPQLAALGAREVTFIGGEAYLHPAWVDIVSATANAGIRATMTTGARAMDATMARTCKEAGLTAVSVSVDGLEAAHDRLRAVRGSWQACMAALEHLGAAGVVPYANTQINHDNLDDLEGLAPMLAARGVRAWQVQLTGPMGRGADQPERLLQPYEMLDLVPRLRALAEQLAPQGLHVHAANNLGYFGPHEHVLRLHPWQGCAAGRYTLGIEANGDVKGCPSLPSAPYVGGNLRHRSLQDLWDNARELAFARDRGTEELWGDCARCYYAPVCKGGCSWTAHTLLGRRGNMPWCHHRAEMLRDEGIRERLVQVEAAPGKPFDFGRFELVEEPWPEGPQNESGSLGRSKKKR